LLCIKRNSDTTITVSKYVQPGIIANIAKGTMATSCQQLNTNFKKYHTVTTRSTSVVTFPDLMTALANTAITFQFLETDILNSAVTNLSIIPDAAETLMRALHTDTAQAWIENMEHYPHIPFDILRRFGTGISMLASWATDPQRNTNLQNGVEPLDTNKILTNVERHFEDIVHDINKAVANTNAGNFGTTPTPLRETVCPTDANHYKHKQRVHLGIQQGHSDNRPRDHGNNNRNKEKKTYNSNAIPKGFTGRPKNKMGIFKRLNPKVPLGLQNIPKWTRPDNKEAELCVRFCESRGPGCSFGQRCFNFHRPAPFPCG
jgi:hypothetical protein